MPLKFFRPARINTGNRWYIIFYQTHPDTGKLVRHRESFDLGRIKDLSERQRMAKYWCEQVNKRLPLGYPYEQRIREKTTTYTLEGAITLAFDVRTDSDRRNTIKTVKTVYNAFTKWMKERKLQELPIADFTPLLAQEWLDWLRKPVPLGTKNRLRNNKRMANTTWNSYLEKIKSMFNVMVDRELIYKSPFSKFKNRREEPKQRRPVTPDEIAALIVWMKANDPNLLAVCLHLYVMMIRPVELRRIKVHEVDYSSGVLTVNQEHAKMRRARHATVPESLRELMIQRLETASSTDYLFGSDLAPSPTKAGTNLMYNRHRKALEACSIDYQSGATLYSWKDSGITHMAQALGMFAAQSQAGHTNSRITERYVHRAKVNQDVAQMKIPGI